MVNGKSATWSIKLRWFICYVPNAYYQRFYPLGRPRDVVYETLLANRPPQSRRSRFLPPPVRIPIANCTETWLPFLDCLAAPLFAGLHRLHRAKGSPPFLPRYLCGTEIGDSMSCEDARGTAGIPNALLPPALRDPVPLLGMLLSLPCSSHPPASPEATRL